MLFDLSVNNSILWQFLATLLGTELIRWSGRRF